MLGLLFFVLLTIFLLMRLNSILGMHIGYSMDRDELIDLDDDDENEADIQDVTLSKKDKNLLVLQKVDSDFTEEIFLNKAKKAFEMIFSAYANEDTAVLKALMHPRIFRAFQLAIQDRQKRGEKLEGSILRFIRTEIEDVDLNDGKCFVKVKFVTEQSEILKNANGDVIEGDVNFAETHTDVWTFSKDISDRSPAWYLTEISSN